jgi:hypothetical protein
MPVFISYRREDTEGDTRALYNRLLQDFAKRHFFFDFASIQGGEDWSSKISRTLNAAQAVLVVIGRGWLEIITDRARQRGTDVVRLEIAAALNNPRLRVIPVLLHGAEMPAPGSLPEDLRALTARQAIDIRGPSWEADVQRLVKTLQDARALPARSSTRLRWYAAASMGFAGMLYFVVRSLFVGVPSLPAGLTIIEAEERLAKAGLRLEKGPVVFNEPSPEPVRVFDQDPPAHSLLPKGGIVKVIGIHHRLRPLVCRAGDGFQSSTKKPASAAVGDPTIPFRRQSADGGPQLDPGTCAWDDRYPMRSGEPTELFAGESTGNLQTTLRSPGQMVYLCVYNEERRPRLVVVRYWSNFTNVLGGGGECPTPLQAQYH